MNIGELFVRLTADATGVKRGAKEAESSLLSFEGIAKRAAGALAAVFTVQQAAQFGAASIHEFMEAEAIWARLATTVDATGTSFASVQQKINSAADAMKRATTVGDEDFARALQRLTLQTGDVSRALGVMDIAADLAAARQIDIADAADVLGKALGGNTTQLTRMFPALKGSTDLLGDLRAQLKGAAESEAKTLTGATIQLTNAWGDLKEAVGGALVGGRNSVDSLNILTNALNGVSGWIDDHRGMFDQLRSDLSTFASKTQGEAKAISDAWQVVADKWNNARDAWRNLMATRSDRASGFTGTGAGGSWAAPVERAANTLRNAVVPSLGTVVTHVGTVADTLRGAAAQMARLPSFGLAPAASDSRVGGFNLSPEEAARSREEWLRSTEEARLAAQAAGMLRVNFVEVATSAARIPSALDLFRDDLNRGVKGALALPSGGTIASMIASLNPATILLNTVFGQAQGLISRGISGLFSHLFGGGNDGVSSSMQRVTSSGNDLAKTLDRINQGVINASPVFDLALRRRQAQLANPSLPTGAGGDPREKPSNPPVAIHIHNPPAGMDTALVARQVTRAIVEAKRRGGVTELDLALGAA